jgi:hypothetical protein
MPFITFVRTGECPELVRRIYGSREIPPDIAAVLEGRSAEPGFLGQFIEKIRNEGSVARGLDIEAYNASLQIVHRAQF